MITQAGNSIPRDKPADFPRGSHNHVPGGDLTRGAPSRTRQEAFSPDPAETGRKKLFSEIPCLKGDRIVLRKLVPADAPSLAELTGSPNVYRYLPTFLFEQKYADARAVIDRLYDECWTESIILGVFWKNPDTGAAFCGLAEMYGYKASIRKISVGYRLLERCWGKGIASEALGLMIDYLYNETDIEIITASTMIENQASARVLMKNGFCLVAHAVDEDWGYEQPAAADKWIR